MMRNLTRESCRTWRSKGLGITSRHTEFIGRMYRSVQILGKFIQNWSFNISVCIQTAETSLSWITWRCSNRWSNCRKKKTKQYLSCRWLNIRRFFLLWLLKAAKNVLSHYPEELYFRWIVLRIVIWHIF